MTDGELPPLKAEEPMELASQEQARAADAAGDTAVSESVTQIPVNHEETVKGPAGDTDASTQQWRQENWEHDAEKAHAEAIAGDPAETKRAAEEGALKALEEFPIKEQAINDDPRSTDEDPKYGSVLSDWGTEQHDKLHEQTEAALSKTQTYFNPNVLRHRRFEYRDDLDLKERDADDLERSRRIMRLKAENQKQRAESLEKWGAVLHDHPISEVYSARYPELEITPNTLVAWENNNEAEAKELDSIEQAFSNMNAIEVLRLNGSSIIGWLGGSEITFHDLVGDYQDDAETAEMKRLSNDGTTTLDQIKSFYMDMLGKKFIQPERARIALTNAVLQDIESGRASEVS